jgi:isopentenyl-diphosphate delta-isomerase
MRTRKRVSFCYARDMANPLEPVDIVDEDNNILYGTTKGEAHEKGLLHRTVIAPVFTTQGHWLLVEQSADRQDAGQFVSPVGGHARTGETEEEALRREALEEIGHAEIAFQLKGRSIFNREILGRKENHYFIIFEITTDDPLVLGDEAVSYKQFTEDELKQALKTTPERFGNAFHHMVGEFYPHLLS